MPDRVIVELDEDLSDLIPGFLTRKRADVITILDANARRDYAEISRIAHRVKGEGGSYGFQTMTEIGRSLERAAAMRDDLQILVDLAAQAVGVDDDRVGEPN